MDVNNFSFTMGGGPKQAFDPLGPAPVTRAVKEPTMEPSAQGRVWFMVFLPLLGLFLENYAESKWTGLFLWCFIVVCEIVTAVIDLRVLRQESPENDGLEGLKKWVWLGPVYVFRREALLGHETYKAIMFGVFFFAALTMNGFVSARLVNTDSIPDIIDSTSVSTLDNVSGEGIELIGQRLDSYLGKDRTWECEKADNGFTAVCTGEHGGENIAVAFIVRHDGYTYHGIRVTGVTVDGETLEGDGYKELMTAIFIEDDSDSDDTEDSGDTVESE